MVSFYKATAIFGVGCLISLMAGCAATNLVDVWHDSSYQSPPLKKMLVIAVRKDPAKRRIWEDAFAGKLEQYGVSATASYRLFTDIPPDTDQIIATVQEKGFDGLMEILTLPTETTVQRMPGYVITEEDINNRPYYISPYYSLRYGPYWHRYGSYYREIIYPGYIDSQTVAIHSIDVSTTGNDGRLVWSATSRTPEPGSVANLQSGIADVVITKLSQRNIIGPKR